MLNESSGVFLGPGAAVGPYRIASVPVPGVYEAVDPITQVRVALRPLPTTADTNRLQAAIEFRHPNVVPVLSVDVHGGKTYAVSEYAGTSLADTLATRGRLGWRDATRIVADACRGLLALHAAGFIHAGLGPSNIARDPDGRTRIADFGLSLPPAAHYAAPERHAGLPGDRRSDIYSLGAIYFALLSGRPPFHGASTPAAVAHAHNHETTPSVRGDQPDLPLRCDAIVQRAMAKNPADRYPDAAAMLADLDALAAADLTAPPLPPMPSLGPKRRSWREWLRSGGVALALLAAASAAGYAVFSRKDSAKDDKAKVPRPLPLPRIVNSVGMTLVQVPRGEFAMGDPLRGDAPLHRVVLVRGFWVGVHEVSQKQYQLVTGMNPSRFQGDSYPVENVSWSDAVEFCKKLSARDEEVRAGRSYRLPTEAEWEYCCRAGTRTAYANGPGLTVLTANARLGGLSRTAAVGTYAPNSWGLYDVHGNVWEWCADWYDMHAYMVGSGIDPTGPDDGRVRVVRGGSFQSLPEECRAGYRNDTFVPESKAPDVGFRVVCVTDQPAP